MKSRLFEEVLDQARGDGRVRLDLTEREPARAGLGWTPAALEALLEPRRGEAAPSGAEARDAVASYLAGHGARVDPAGVVLARSRRELLREAIAAVCGTDGEVAVPAPGRTGAGLGPVAGVRTYELVFDGRWRIDLRSLRRAVGARTRAVVVGNPAEPAGAALSAEELSFLERLCAERGLALVADEAGLDATLEPARSVATLRGCLAVHLSGLSGVCGLPRLDAEWAAVAGPAPLAGPLASRLAAAAAPAPGAPCIPPLLARREEFLAPLRARLSRNRSALASASLREAPWTLQWGGGWWAVLQVNSTQDDDAVCLALLEDGVAALPGSAFGLPQQGYLVLSLLPAPEVFDAAMDRVERRLRRAGFP